MQRWAMPVLVGVCSSVVVAAFAGTGYQWLATLKDLAATPALGRLVRHRRTPAASVVHR
jgi:hypothetical protein